MVDFSFCNMTGKEIAEDLLCVIQKIDPHVSPKLNSEYAGTPLLSMNIGLDYIHMVYLVLVLQNRYGVDILKMNFDNEESYTFNKILYYITSSISSASQE